DGDRLAGGAHIELRVLSDGRRRRDLKTRMKVCFEPRDLHREIVQSGRELRNRVIARARRGGRINHARLRVLRLDCGSRYDGSRGIQNRSRDRPRASLAECSHTGRQETHYGCECFAHRNLLSGTYQSRAAEEEKPKMAM